MLGEICAVLLAGTPGFDGEGPAVAALLERATPETEAALESLGGELLALGPEATDELFWAHWQGALQPDWSPGRERELTLSEGQLGAVRHALLREPDAQLYALCESIRNATWDPDQRRAALDVIAERRFPGDLELGLLLATPPDPERPLPRALRAALRAALSAIIAREPGVGPVLRMRFATLGTALQPLAIDALGELEPELALEQLAGCLDKAAQLDVLVLRGLESAALRAPLPAPLHVRGAVREQLLRNDPALSVLAARCSAALSDADAVAPLIELLTREDANVRDAARAALCALAGMDLGARASDWGRWHQQELAFWRGPGPALLQELQHMPPLEMGAAIRDLARHRLYRGEIGVAILPCLQNDEVGVRVLACAALSALRAHGAQHALAELLDDESELVREAAREALELLTAESRAGSS